MQLLKKIFAVALLLVFFVETTPDALWHLFADHHDTHEVYSSEPAVSVKHIHCDALQLSLPVFSAGETVIVPVFSIKVADFLAAIPGTSFISPVIFFSGRAPPAL